MSYSAYSSMRHLLIQDSKISSQVGVSNIRVGFGNLSDSYPCITLSQAGGESYGYLGWGTSPHGSKLSRDNNSFQVDVYSRDSIQELEQICDNIKPALLSGNISGNGLRKINDNYMWEDSLHAHRKILTWTFSEEKND
jgi:hypothetical protein